MVKMLDNPCPKCSWKYAGGHICVIDMRTPQGVRAATTPNYDPTVRPKRSNRVHQPDFGSAEDRANRSESVKAARASEAGRAERDAEIIRLYDEQHYSMNGVAARMNLDFRTVQKVIRAAADRGDILLQLNSGGRPRQLVG